MMKGLTLRALVAQVHYGPNTYYTAGKEISCILWNPKIHYCVHKILPLDPILSQLNPIHTLTPCFSKIHFNIAPPQ
jgi:hypothetical protein